MKEMKQANKLKQKDLSEQSSWEVLDDAEGFLLAKMLEDHAAKILVSSEVVKLLVLVKQLYHYVF